MSDAERHPDTLAVLPGPASYAGTVVTLAPIGSIATFQVMEHELDSLDVMVARESQALGFFTASAGSLASVIASVATSTPTTALGVGVMTALGLVSFVAMAWYGLSWQRERKARPKLLATIKARAAARAV